MKGKRAGHTGEAGMWRQKWVLAAGGELFRERESSSHKDVDVQRQNGLHSVVLPSHFAIIGETHRELCHILPYIHL